jgi:hypothetical protein
MTEQVAGERNCIYKSYDEFRAKFYTDTKQTEPDERQRISASFGKVLAKLVVDKVAKG